MSSGNPGDAPRLTDEQRRPLTVTGSSVALSAGAGCGKTTVLTERFLGALDGDASGAGRRPLKALAALTFTEKAARELRQRIRADCHLRLDRASGEEVGHWRAVLRGLEAAPVSTFHEYCARLLRRHALDAAIDPDFQVLDAAIADSVLVEAMTRLLRGWLADRNPDLIELAVEYGLRSVRDSLGSLIVGRDAGALEAWAERTEDEVLAAWRGYWDREGRKALSAPLLRACSACKTWLDVNELDNPKLKAMRSGLLALLPEVATRTDRAWLTELREQAKLPGGLRAQHWPSAEVNESARAVLGKLRDAIDAYLKKAEPDEAVSIHCATQGLRFARLARDARRAYDEAKRARGGLDFDDLLVKTRDLFTIPPNTPERERPGQGIEFLMVDEFQDTDPVQIAILRSLSGESFATGRMFVVGDFKQSIYRFRGARPQLFQDVRGEFPTEGRHDLTENFRSAVGVIDFVNALFETAFPDESPRLVPGPDAAPAADGPAVEFVWAEEEEEEEGEKEKEKEKRKRATAGEMRRTEARWLARLIRKRLEAGWPIRDRTSKTVRNAEEKDVAFLFRAMTDLAPYENALQTEGINFHVVGGKAFYAQQEVLDLANVLSVIEDPVDQVALAGALRGPFFGLSDDALFRLAGTGTGDLAEGLERSGSLDGLPRLDRERAVRARKLLAAWRGLKDHLPIAELVDRVLDESGFEAALLGEFLGDRKRANARKLVRLARRFDARGGFTLGHFVIRLREDLRRPPREEQAATTEEEGTSVRLMSIHQAKGLEFPIVIVPDLNRKQDLARKPVAFHPDLGPLVRPGKTGPADDGQDDEDGSGRSLGLVAFEAVERLVEEAESIRLFYVATTRARDSLILSAGVGPDANPASAGLRLLDARFDRRSGVCRAALPDGWAVPSVRVTTQCPPRIEPPRARKRRPRLRAVARVIESARLHEATAGPVGSPRPRFVDLDAARGLSPRADRLDRLVRSILADLRAFSPGMLGEVARLAGRRQNPMAHADLVAEALRALEPWLIGSFGASLARSKEVERGIVWTVDFGGTVFQGRTEFFARDPNGVGRAVIFSPPGAPEPVERLRLLLAYRAFDHPIAEGWRVRLGDGLHGEVDFRDEAIEEVLKSAGFHS